MLSTLSVVINAIVISVGIRGSRMCVGFLSDNTSLLSLLLLLLFCRCCCCVQHQCLAIYFCLFTIEAFGIEKSGRLYTNITLDRETQSSYNLTVIASDGGSPPKTATTYVEIEVLDRNDNSPKFSNASYSVEIPEDVPVGYNVYQVGDCHVCFV